ncbi:penicillin-insensitive murein endopeptidase [Litoreibacter roseus]|uniref:Penicillin-insensitive murein endopeptidase n=1 Tax=Litoreibacter roseus TaxID=2601869 RepID=A0A6N6JHP4_9RHOB|nr:penicillin-insensitive murein endopeptidase [Litoreibacter roseus]GFE64742.1 penicillin-insensitive murein endopeptidase [Litoreibacter roseus]
MDLRTLGIALIFSVCSSTFAATAEPLAKTLFGAKRAASQQTAKSHGSYSRGCAAGLVQLPESGKTWQAMRLSRNRNWGHPELIDFAKDLSRKADKLGWAGLYFGDFSQPRGGPMLTGHRSHQIGLDADVWLYPVSRVNLTKRQRENISAVSMRRANGAYVNKNWTRTHHEIVKAAAKDKRVARIFIFPGAKVQMCKDERGNRDWLRKVRPWWGHHYHFHVRLKCQRGSSNCVNQAAPPPGDGCADAQRWVNEILNPPPPPKNPAPAKPRREYVLADLPQACTGVLSSR